MFSSVLDSAAETLSVSTAMLCMGVCVLCGLVTAVCYCFSAKRYTKNFAVTLVFLPVLVQSVIMMVNGSLGAGVAVLGTFSLVRFRSAPGTAQEIAAVFGVMAIGIAAGMGQLAFAALLTVIVCLLLLILNKTPFGEPNRQERTLKIIIPETLDYTEVFDDIFADHTQKAELESVKTTNMGSLYELRYTVRLRKNTNEKAFMDALRCRNGNLNIQLSRPTILQEML